jgi:hypothetical protein
MTKSRWAATGLLALAFALGGLVGGAATMAADKDHPREGLGGRSRAGYMAQMRREYLDQLRRELNLTADQEQAVVQVLDRHQPAMDSLWRAVRTQFDHQFDTERRAVRRDIRATLAPEQQDKYDAFVIRRDSIHQAREAGRDQVK